MKKFSWLSYWSLILSIFPIPFFFAMVYGLIIIHFYFGLSVAFLSIILSLILGIKAVFKQTEKNILAGIAIYIALFSAGALVILYGLSFLGNSPR
ncbi:hypothetical protein [Bacillus sp. AK031]